MKNLVEDLKKEEFKQIYLLYGDESYLKKQYKNKLCSALVPSEDTINVSRYEGKGINVSEVIDLAETHPFFSERRLIIMENTGFFKNACEELAGYVKELSEASYFVFIESEVGKRGKLYKVVKEKGRVVEFKRQDEKTLSHWILGMLKREKKKITEATMELLLSKTGTDMENIEMELEKLISYTLDRDVISSEDVEEICTTRTTNKIFDMIRAISEKKQKIALELYYDLLALKEPPMRILFLIARQFNLLMQVKDLLKLGFNQEAISQKMGLQSFIVRNYLGQAKNFTEQRLKEAVEDCVDAEEAVKTGHMNDVMSVELLIVKYSC